MGAVFALFAVFKKSTMLSSSFGCHHQLAMCSVTCRMVLQSGHGSNESYTLSMCGETYNSRWVGPQQSLPPLSLVLCIKKCG